MSGAADFTSDCVKPLSKLSALVALNVSDTAIDDYARHDLTTLTQLTRINLACTDCGVLTAEALVQLPRLCDVSMCGSPEWRRAGGGLQHQVATGAAQGGDSDSSTDSSDSGDEMCVEDRDERLRGLQGVPAVLALVPCMKLKRVAVPEKVMKDTRRSVEGCGGHVPAWMWGGLWRACESELWSHELV